MHSFAVWLSESHPFDAIFATLSTSPYVGWLNIHDICLFPQWDHFT